MHLLTAALSGHATYTQPAAAPAEQAVMSFALDTTDEDFAAVLAAIPDATLLGTHVDNADINLYSSTITPAELEASGATLDPLKTAAYPNVLCRHRWLSLASFNISGWQMLGESESGVWAVAGRSSRFIRPQQDYGETADNYGAGDGTTHYDAYNGREDTGTRQLATDYFLSGGDIMYGWDDGSDPGNAVTDATGMGAASRIREMSDPDWPAMIWSGGRIWDRASDGAKTPFEEYDATNSVYVCGGFRNNGGVGSTSTYQDLDLPSSAMTLNATLLLQRYSLTGKAALSDLDGSGGQCRFHQPSAQSTSIISATFTFDGTSTYTDETLDSRASPADAEIVPVGAANNHAFYIGMPFKFSECYLRGTDTAGGRVIQPQVGGTYVLEYWNGSTWGTFASVDDQTSGLTVIDRHAYWAPPSDWATTTVNSWGPYYYIRWRKTGGTVTQACNLEWWEAGNDGEPWDAVKVFDGSSTYTDYLWEAINPTADDIPALPVSAANGAGLYFCAAKTFSQAVINLSQVQVGATMAIQYSLGSGSWGTFTNINDPSAGLTTGTAQQIIEFNKKIDWATDTVDGVTGYWIRIVKTGGTVTQAGRLDSATSFRERSIFIHRYDDQPVVNGMTKLTAPYDGRGKLETSGKGNIEFHRVRSIGINLMDTHMDELFFYGCQYVLGGDLRVTSGTVTWTMAAGQYGTRWWDIDDHEVQDKTQGNIPDVLERIQYAIDNKDSTDVNPRTGNTIGSEITAVLTAAGITTPDLTKYDNMADWNEFMLFGEGTYGSDSAVWTKLFGGHKFRYCGGALDGINDTRIYVKHGIDGHSDAMYGNYDNESLGSVFEQMGFENHHRAMNYYPQGTGNNDKPIAGDGSTRRAIHLLYAYFTKWSGNTDDTGCAGFMMESDGDSGLYETGNGACDDIMCLFTGFKDTVNADGSGSGISVTQSNCAPTAWFNAFDNPGTCAHINGGFSNNGPRSCYAYSYDGVSAYDDLTNSLKSQGRAFDGVHAWDGVSAFTDHTTGAGDDTLQIGGGTTFTTVPVSAANGYYLAFVDADQYSFISINTNQRQVGGTGVWEYSQGSGVYATLSVTDGVSGFTAGNINGFSTVSFTPPGDWATDTVNGDTGYVVRWRKTGGTVTTLGRGNEVRGRKYEFLFPTGATGEKLYLAISEYFIRRFTFGIPVAGVGSPTLAWRYWNGSAFTSVGGTLSDGTSGFTTTGTVTFNRPTDAEQTTINGKLAYWVEVEITAGSFSTIPRADKIETVVESAGIDLQHNVIRNLAGAANNGMIFNIFQSGSAPAPQGYVNVTGYIIDAYNTIYLNEGQTADTTIYRINGVNNYDLEDWQARSKTALTSDSPQDSYFGLTNTLVPFA